MPTLEQQYRTALSAVQDETLKLIARDDLPKDVHERLLLIESICRHGIDVRSEGERMKSK